MIPSSCLHSSVPSHASRPRLITLLTAFLAFPLHLAPTLSTSPPKFSSTLTSSSVLATTALHAPASTSQFRLWSAPPEVASWQWSVVGNEGCVILWEKED
ncbi:hypothetical protein CH063_12631 [Colletotrichum higginsianum]|uniref:Uncharacterized protein n=1 Tax=Colletotrichum higginsianum (strain IMI 349063) TaxID=759273 RepID=H1VR59_COLHI|nr:hypothetical protein CH063_12631 [Colletotrichum higginsianum]